MTDDDFVIVVDSREKIPYEFEGYDTVVDGLETGDYTVQGYEDVFAVERKSLDDFLKSITWDRDRFKREIIRGDDLLGFTIVIESDVQTILQWNYRRKVHPNSVMGTIQNWSDHHNAYFVWGGDREGAEAETVKCLERWYNAHLKLYS